MGASRARENIDSGKIKANFKYGASGLNISKKYEAIPERTAIDVKRATGYSVLDPAFTGGQGGPSTNINGDDC